MCRLRIRGRVIAYWTVAVAVALGTGAFVAGVVQSAEARAARYGAVRRVLVARHRLPAGAVLRAGDLASRDIPAAFVPQGDTPTSLVGRTVVVPMAAGEVVLASKVAPEGLHGIAALLHAGERALALPVGPGTPPLAVGDEVEVLASAPDTGDTIVVARVARVLGVDDRAVTVAVLLDDAPSVARALATATVTLALTAP